MALFEIENLSFTYNGATGAALKEISLTVHRGEFLVLCGESGCGKTTLLKLLKKQLRPAGRSEGTVLFCGTPVDALEDRRSAAEIGFVMQNPDDQIITDRVWHELAFGLESLGECPDVIRRKVAEICGFFGIGEWYHRKTCELSGGQKQVLSLASVLVTDPCVLILDEPTAQLDPIAASEFLSLLKRINEELGVTVILSEHRLEEVFPMAGRVVLMEHGRIVLCDTPRNVGARLSSGKEHHPLRVGMPAAVRLFSALDGVGESPLTVREGKRYLTDHYNQEIRHIESEPVCYDRRERAIELSGGYFRYARELPDVLCGTDLTVYRNEILCILGANGSGKTTLLRVLSGIERLYQGEYRIWGKNRKAYRGNTLWRGNLSCLPQDPQNLFVGSTVYADLSEVTHLLGYGKESGDRAVEEVAEKLGIGHLFQRHPYDLSGGEQQKAALAKILLMQPKILLLDEPTKGLDASAKREFAALLDALRKEGKTIVTVTHDVEFAAECADRCAMFFDGQIVSCTDRVNFFADNRFYTTAAARMTRPMFDNAVTVEMAVELCRRNGKRADHGTA